MIFRIVMGYLLIETTFSWYPCNRSRCYQTPNKFCMLPDYNTSKLKYCDVTVGWESSCRTNDCGYVFDFRKVTGNKTEISGVVTALRGLIPSADNTPRPVAPSRTSCWTYVIFPKHITHFCYNTSQKTVNAPKNADLSMEFKTQKRIAQNYTVSMPCSKRREKFPSLLKRDIILYVLQNGVAQSQTEYQVEWLAGMQKKMVSPHDHCLEIFREASIDPADFTTVPATTTAEKTTTATTTTTSTTTTTTTTTKRTTTTVRTTTPPLYTKGEIPILKNVSQEIYANHANNEQRNFTSEKELEDSSEKTIEVTDKLASLIKNENINLEAEMAISYITAVSETTNTIVAEKNAETWREVSQVKRTETLNRIIENADSVTNTIVESIATPQSITTIRIVQRDSVSVMLVPTKTEDPVVISPSENVKVALPSSTVMSLSQNTPVIVATNIHIGAEACYDEISPSNVDIVDRLDGTVDFNPALAFHVDTPLQIITEIVSVNIKPKPVNKKITLVFRHVRNITDIRVKLYCAYIDKLTGRWTNHKCNITKTNQTHTTFESDHLTNFAILMQIVDFVIPEQHRKNLSLITYIGMSISIFCLVLSLCVFALVNNIHGHRTERYHLHANLALGMLLGQVTFLAGAGYPPGTDSCKATAILLHFFYLSAFSWMLVEGLHLYNLVVKVFRSAQNKLGYYYMVGWGIPLLICAISVSAAFGGYGEEKNCWLDIENSRVIWAFVGPVLFVILINTIILFKVTRVISSLAKSQDNCAKCQTDRATMAICAKAIAVLMPILGITWVLGVIAVNQDLIVFQYVFVVFNSLQGFFLFMFHCVFNSETRASLVYRTKSLRTDISSRSATNSRRRRDTKVELTRNAEEMGPSTSADIPSTSTRQDHSRYSNSAPTTSRQASAASSNTLSNRDTASYGRGSAKIKATRINPNVSRAW